MSRYYYARDDYVHLYTVEAPKSSKTTRYIVNDGNLVINDKALRRGKTIVYNSPGATMWVTPKAKKTSSSSSSKSWIDSWVSSTSSSSASSSSCSRACCRDCCEDKDLYGGYCHDCVQVRVTRSRPRIEYVREERRVSPVSERRYIEYI